MRTKATQRGLIKAGQTEVLRHEGRYVCCEPAIATRHGIHARTKPVRSRTTPHAYAHSPVVGHAWGIYKYTHMRYTACIDPRKSAFTNA